MKDLIQKIIDVNQQYPNHNLDLLLESEYGDEATVEIEVTAKGRVRVYDVTYMVESMYLEDYLTTMPEYKVMEIGIFIRRTIPMEGI